MDRAHAQRIVVAYRFVLGPLLKFSYGIPESVLPFHKAEIKAALRAMLMEAENEREQRTYVESYLHLARFLPDLQGYRGMLVQTAIDMEDAAWLAEQPPPVDLIESMRYEHSALQQELSRFMGGN